MSVLSRTCECTYGSAAGTDPRRWCNRMYSQQGGPTDVACDADSSQSLERTLCRSLVLGIQRDARPYAGAHGCSDLLPVGIK